MPESLIQQVVEDPLLSNFELGLRRLYYPLGFRIEVQPNSREVIEAASEAWGLFSQSFDIPPMRLALGVRPANQAEPLPAKTNFMAGEHLMSIVMNADNFAVCDFNAAFSFGWITPALASDSSALRYRLLT